MIVNITQQAESDLVEIATWIARDNPARAFSFILELRHACVSLGEFPRRYPPAPLFGPNSHQRTYGNYLIVYEVFEDEVRVDTIVHGARNLDDLT